MSKHQQQANREIHEDQVLNFLVNRLDEKVSLNLANNAEIDAEDIYEVLVGATADGTSISTLCNSSEDSPSANTILYHLRTKFEPFRLERVANTLIRRDIVELLTEQVEVWQTSTCGLTTVMKTTRRTSITRKPSVEPLRSTPTRRYRRV